MKRAVGPMKKPASPGREAVIRALDNCYDPCGRDHNISVVDMGLIESLEIQDREVRIKMVLTTGWCPFAARLFAGRSSGLTSHPRPRSQSPRTAGGCRRERSSSTCGSPARFG